MSIMATEMAPKPLPRTCPPDFIARTFTTPSGAELSVRIWPADPPVDKPAPFVSYTHGGGWYAGNHFAPLAWMFPGFRQRGYHVVSHNYRLCPQVSLDTILTDCLDAIAWCRATLPDILGADKVDVDRYVVCGESAGGHLVALMAHHLSPAPKAVINAYGAVDPLAFWPLLGPLPPADPSAPPWSGEFSEAELEALFKDREPANIISDALWWDENKHFSEQVLFERWHTEFKYTRRVRIQAEEHQWRNDLGARPAMAIRSVLKGVMHEERFADEGELRSFILSMSPSPLLLTKTSYPPTAFLHGTADKDVPLAQSEAMAQRLKDMGVPVVESYEPGMGHVFDNKYISPDVPGWDTYIQPVLDFCNLHVNRS